jgi:hypothetical protein
MSETKQEQPQSEEFQRFQKAVKDLLNVSPEERKEIDEQLEREAGKQKNGTAKGKGEQGCG